MFHVPLCYLFEVLHNSCLNNNALLPSIHVLCVAATKPIYHTHTHKFRYMNASCLLGERSRGQKG